MITFPYTRGHARHADIPDALPDWTRALGPNRHDCVDEIVAAYKKLYGKEPRESDGESEDSSADEQAAEEEGEGEEDEGEGAACAQCPA